MKKDYTNITILVVDDEEVNCEYLVLLLKKFKNINVIVSYNGIIAIEICKNHEEINLVLMDIKMPEMDGIEVTKIIKSFRPNLPIISTTAFDMNLNLFDDNITKPIYANEFISIMEKYIGK